MRAAALRLAVKTLFAPRNGGYKVADFTLTKADTLTVTPTSAGATHCPGFNPAAPELRVPTFDEVITLAKAHSARASNTVGICPEAEQADPKAAADTYQAFLARGLDGLFGNYSDLAVAARNKFVAASRR